MSVFKVYSKHSLQLTNISLQIFGFTVTDIRAYSSHLLWFRPFYGFLFTDTVVYSLQILLLLSLINPVNSENVSIIIIHNCGLNKCILEYSSFLPPSNMIFSRNIIFISLIITFASGGKTISGVRFQNIYVIL